MTDQGKSTSQIALERMEELTLQQSRFTVGKLTELRDQIDETIAAIERGKDECVARFRQQSTAVQRALTFHGIISEGIQAVNSEIAETLSPPTLSSVITGEPPARTASPPPPPDRRADGQPMTRLGPTDDIDEDPMQPLDTPPRPIPD